MSEARWDSILKQNGFNGVRISLPDYEDNVGHTASVMVSTATSSKQNQMNTTVAIVTLDQSSAQTLAKDLKNDLNALLGAAPRIHTLEEVQQLELSNTTCISLIEMEHTIFKDLDHIHLGLIQRLFGASGILWAIRGAVNPDAHLIQGLARSVRNEIAGLRLVTVDLDEVQSSGQSPQEIITSVFKLTFLERDYPGEDDLEIVERNGILSVPRVTHDMVSEASGRSYTQMPKPKLQTFSHTSRQLVAKQSVEGSLSGFYFDDREKIIEDDMSNDEICVDVRASGLTFRNVMVALGQIPGKLGSEISGVVTKVGANVTNVARGDRVCALTYDTIATSVKVHKSQVAQIPESMSFTDAASSVTVFSTAKYCLIDKSLLQPGERVLIHAAAGGVGQAAILIAQKIGAEVFATVGSLEKKNFLVATYRIPECHIFSSRDTAFGEQIRQITNGNGVDVVLKSLADEPMRVSLGCLAPFGRFVEIGKRDILQNTFLEIGNLKRSQSFFIVDLMDVMENRLQQAQNLLTEAMELLHNGMPVVSPVTILPLNELEMGFRMLQAGKVIGKVVFDHCNSKEILVSRLSFAAKWNG